MVFKKLNYKPCIFVLLSCKHTKGGYCLHLFFALQRPLPPINKQVSLKHLVVVSSSSPLKPGKQGVPFTV